MKFTVAYAHKVSADSDLVVGMVATRVLFFGQIL